MTLDEFKHQGFGAGMKCKYESRVYDIGAVNFKDALIALKEYEYTSEDYMWVRCENIELLTTPQNAGGR